MQKSALRLLGFCAVVDFIDCVVVWIFAWWLCGFVWESILGSIFGRVESKKSILYTRANRTLSVFFGKKV